MDIHARKAEKEDREGMITLWKRFMTEEENAVDEIQGIDKAAKGWEWRLDKQIEEGVAFVVIADKEVVGFTGYIGYREPTEEEKGKERPKGMKRLPLAPGVAFINDIYIAPEARESNSSKALFAVVIEGISEKGFDTIWTNTSIRNRRTQILLERMGFRKTEAFTLSGMKDQVCYEKKVG
jgi:RimJ/RimL family protein N-acetyltransferase